MVRSIASLDEIRVHSMITPKYSVRLLQSCTFFAFFFLFFSFLFTVAVAVVVLVVAVVVFASQE